MDEFGTPEVPKAKAKRGIMKAEGKRGREKRNHERSLAKLTHEKSQIAATPSKGCQKSKFIKQSPEKAKGSIFDPNRVIWQS